MKAHIHYKKVISVTTIILLIISGCTTKSGGFQCAPANSKAQISMDSLRCEAIRLDSISTSSFSESTITPDNDIVFIDKNFCKVSVFDTTGHFKRDYLGLGGAPHETQIGRIAAQTILSDGRLVLLGHNLDFHLFKDYICDSIFILNRNCSDQTLEGDSKTYTNQYNDMVCRSYKNNIYLNVYAEHPEFNYLEHTEKYLQECRHLWEIDLNQQKDTRLLAKGYPQSYHKDPKKHVIFTGTCYDIDNKGNFYINYDTDPSIYVYDYDFNPIATYGLEGKNMNTDYLYIDNYKECRKNYRSERETKGYYYWIEYVDETGLLFRSYKKQSGTLDGLQIYKEGIMIADINVPKGLRVMGYIAPYYYSYIIPQLAENDDSLILYRFKMEES